MNDTENTQRIERRVVLQWISSATASVPFLGDETTAAEHVLPPTAKGYGPDPDLLRAYAPGDLWPLTFDENQRRLVRVLSDIIVPADETSPGASAVGVPDFIDEWISSPYPGQQGDRALILKGLAWLDEEAERRGAADFVSLGEEGQLAICGELSVVAARDRKAFPGSFFRRLRDLVAGGYYTTPEGMRDIGYRGNVAMPEWNGPPPEVLEKLGLKAE